ncbi:MAG: acyltransferase [Thermodesulfobacteriota bacterium]|jgi:acetyltransferase-like isoleucine patch superfamily enzyme
MYTLNKVAYLTRVLRKNPSELWRLLRIGLTTAKYRYVKRCVGKGTVVGTRTEIINSANVRIGNGCLLQDAVYIRAGAEGSVTIGDRAALNSFCRLFGHGSIEIGEDAQLGPGTLITTTGHDYRRDLETHFQGVVIGKGVWVGANVTILPGVSIGDFSVVGAGSVVTRSIPPRSVAVGAPARVIRQVDAPARQAQVGG